MKLASYIANGQPAFGVVAGDGVITMNSRLGGKYATLRDALADPALAGEHSVCGLLRARGHAVRLVRGEAGNVKITYPEDLQLLRWRLS